MRSRRLSLLTASQFAGLLGFETQDRPPRNFELIANAPEFWQLLGLPAPLIVPYTRGETLTPPPGFGVFFVAKNLRQDEAQVWNFSIQRQSPWNVVVTGAYVGTHGIHLYRDLQLNQAVPGPGPITPQLAGYLLQGWTLSGINVFQKGPPLPVFVASPALNNNGTINEADIICSQVSMPKTVAEWFNTGCFVNPPPYTFGNAGVGHIRAPGIANWDFSIGKAAPISERLGLTFGADFFSITNTPQFQPAKQPLGTAGFGSITSDTPNSPRQIQVWAKLKF